MNETTKKCVCCGEDYVEGRNGFCRPCYDNLSLFEQGVILKLAEISYNIAFSREE
jgi:hypothetical protein